MADALDRLIVGLGCRLDSLLCWLQERNFAAVDDASERLMRREHWRRVLSKRGR